MARNDPFSAAISSTILPLVDGTAFETASPLFDKKFKNSISPRILFFDLLIVCEIFNMILVFINKAFITA
jgi:hypothetical protein